MQMQEKNNLDTPVRYFKGVGPKRGEELAELGMKTVRDVLYYLPSRYEDRSKFTRIRELKIGQSQAVKGEVVSTSSRLSRAGMPMFQITVTDGTGFVHAVWFRQPYLKDYFRKAQQVILYGKVELYDKVQIISPEYEILKDRAEGSIHMGRIVPVYPAAGKLTQKYLRNLTFLAVSQYARLLQERMPTYILARERMVDIKFAIRNIHFPSRFDHLEKAYRRIVFEEFFMLQLALAIRKRSQKEASAGFGHVAAGELVESFKKAIPFELTGGQKKAIADIERDMSSTKPMNRLLEGDVGSGKTIVAAHALVLTVQNGLQGVIMAPTEVLARQHVIALGELLMPLGINVALLIGGMDQKARDAAYSDIKDGKIDIVVGTHAVIQDEVEFKKLGLAVIDEQHKFGVTQRSVLKDKGYSPHILVMTATPIPRTLALTVYGDLDVSVIRELPKGRKPVVTYWVEEEKRQKAYCFIREELSKGRQAYIICPMIEAPAKGVRAIPEKLFKANTKNVTETFEDLKGEAFADYNLGLLHGRMSPKEKDKIMKDFKKGRIDLLVSTVVIEVGIDVPNATVMLIENADRFGLSQLHQLRGRVGRGEHESYCILLADPENDEARRRLKAIEGTIDGFQIAEADLEIRGPGEFFGTRQHGLPEIRFGNIIKDFSIMESARREAFAVVAADPGLSEEHHKPLRASLRERFAGRLDLLGVA
jgi:ATP-dependent DNA helicase RecG